MATSSPLSSADIPLPGQSSNSKHPSKSSGSGESAGIGGNPSATDQKLDKLMESMGQSKKPTFNDRLSTLNDHAAKEQTTVQANINVHAHDH